MRRAGRIAVAIALLTTAFVVTGAGPARADGTLTVTPATGLAHNDIVSIEVTGNPDVPLAQIQFAECGNAYADGTPLTTLNPALDCVVSAWIFEENGQVDMTVKQTGIGVGNRACVASPPAPHPCTIYTAQAINVDIDPPLVAEIEFAQDPDLEDLVAADTMTTVTPVGSPVAVGKTAYAYVDVSTDEPTFSPDGLVTVTEGSTTLGSAALTNGAAHVPLGTATTGTHPLVAHYTGNGSFASSDSASTDLETVAAKNVSVGDLQVVEGNTLGARMIAVPVVLSSAPGVTMTVDYAVNEGSAERPEDFTIAKPTGKVTFKAKNTVKYVMVKIIGDTSAEADQDFTVTVSNPTMGYEVRRGTGTVTILDDDTTPGSGVVVGVGDVQIPEGDSGGAHGAKIAVSLSQPATSIVIVTFQITSETAVRKVGANGDWGGAVTRTVKFNPGQVTKPLTLPTYPELAHELDETVKATAQTVTGVNQSVALSGKTVGRVTLLTDE
jgi:hypothetical protein